MKRILLVALLALLLCTFSGACAEEQADDVPDTSAESRRGRGRLLEKLEEVRTIPADAEGAPMIEGIVSMASFEDSLALAIEIPHFVSGDSLIEKRGVCPGMRERLLVVNPWSDLGFTGKLTLTFYNGVLGTARFGTGNLEAYKKASKAQRGTLIRTVKRHRVNPHVDVWIPPLPPYAANYSDRRVMKWRESVVRACRYQTQIENGDSPPIE